MRYFKERGMKWVYGLLLVLGCPLLAYLTIFHFVYSIQFIMLGASVYGFIRGIHLVIANPVIAQIKHDAMVESRLNASIPPSV